MNGNKRIAVSFDHRGDDGSRHPLIHFPALEGTLQELCEFFGACANASGKTGESIEWVFAQQCNVRPIRNVAENCDYHIELIYPFGYGRLTIFLKDSVGSAVFYGSLDHFNIYINGLNKGVINAKHSGSNKFPKAH